MNISAVLAWRNIWRHKRRTWLTVGAMVFSNFLLIFLISVQLASYDMMIENTLKAFSGHLQIAHRDYIAGQKMRDSIPGIESVVAAINHSDKQLYAAPRAEAFVLASSDTRSFGIQVVGVNPKLEKHVSTIPGLVANGRYLNSVTSGEIVLGETLAKNLKVGLGDEVTLLGSGLDGSFAAAVLSVVGVFDSGMKEINRSLAQVHFSEFDDIFSMTGHGHRVIVNGEDIDQVKTYRERLSAKLDISEPLDIFTWVDVHPEIRQAIQSDMASAWFMYVVLVVLVAFGVMNTQVMSVLERTREFGIMLSIGIRPGRLALLIFYETALMAGLAFLLGASMGVLLIFYLGLEGFSFPGMSEMAEQYNLPDRMYPKISVVSVMLGPACVFIGAMLASVYPALRIMLLKPIAAMRAA